MIYFYILYKIDFEKKQSKSTHGKYHKKFSDIY
jgi:hypothetical protein